MYVYIILRQAKSISDERNWNDSVPDYSLPWNFSGKNTGVCCCFLLQGIFSRQEYWSGLPFLSLGDLPDFGIKPRSPALQVVFCIAGGLPSEPPGKF